MTASSKWISHNMCSNYEIRDKGISRRVAPNLAAEARSAEAACEQYNFQAATRDWSKDPRAANRFFSGISVLGFSRLVNVTPSFDPLRTVIWLHIYKIGLQLGFITALE